MERKKRKAFELEAHASSFVKDSSTADLSTNDDFTNHIDKHLSLLRDYQNLRKSMDHESSTLLDDQYYKMMSTTLSLIVGAKNLLINNNAANNYEKINMFMNIINTSTTTSTCKSPMFHHLCHDKFIDLMREFCHDMDVMISWVQTLNQNIVALETSSSTTANTELPEATSNKRVCVDSSGNQSTLVTLNTPPTDIPSPALATDREVDFMPCILLWSEILVSTNDNLNHTKYNTFKSLVYSIVLYIIHNCNLNNTMLNAMGSNNDSNDSSMYSKIWLIITLIIGAVASDNSDNNKLISCKYGFELVLPTITQLCNDDNATNNDDTEEAEELSQTQSSLPTKEIGAWICSDLVKILLQPYPGNTETTSAKDVNDIILYCAKSLICLKSSLILYVGLNDCQNNIENIFNNIICKQYVFMKETNDDIALGYHLTVITTVCHALVLLLEHANYISWTFLTSERYEQVMEMLHDERLLDTPSIAAVLWTLLNHCYSSTDVRSDVFSESNVKLALHWLGFYFHQGPLISAAGSMHNPAVSALLAYLTVGMESYETVLEIVCKNLGRNSTFFLIMGSYKTDLLIVYRICKLWNMIANPGCEEGRNFINRMGMFTTFPDTLMKLMEYWAMHPTLMEVNYLIVSIASLIMKLLRGSEYFLEHLLTTRKFHRRFVMTLYSFRFQSNCVYKLLDIPLLLCGKVPTFAESFGKTLDCGVVFAQLITEHQLDGSGVMTKLFRCMTFLGPASNDFVINMEVVKPFHLTISTLLHNYKTNALMIQEICWAICSFSKMNDTFCVPFLANRANGELLVELFHIYMDDKSTFHPVSMAIAALITDGNFDIASAHEQWIQEKDASKGHNGLLFQALEKYKFDDENMDCLSEILLYGNMAVNVSRTHRRLPEDIVNANKRKVWLTIDGSVKTFTEILRDRINKQKYCFEFIAALYQVINNYIKYIADEAAYSLTNDKARFEAWLNCKELEDVLKEFANGAPALNQDEVAMDDQIQVSLKVLRQLEGCKKRMLYDRIDDELQDAIPQDYRCAITLRLMVDPVLLLKDCHTYERAAIEKWLQDHDRSPKTNELLSSKELVPNQLAKSIIEDLVNTHLAKKAVTGATTANSNDTSA